jgi:uncharacterized membrane protein YgcG
MDSKTSITFSTMAIAAVAILFALGPIIVNQAFAYGGVVGYCSYGGVVGYGSYTGYVGYHHHHHHHHHHYYGGNGPYGGGYGGGNGPYGGGYGDYGY